MSIKMNNLVRLAIERKDNVWLIRRAKIFPFLYYLYLVTTRFLILILYFVHSNKNPLTSLNWRNQVLYVILTLEIGLESMEIIHQDIQ